MMTTLYKICPHCSSKIVDGEVCECRKKDRNEYSKKYYESNKELKKMLNSKQWKNTRSMIIKRDGCMCNRCYVQLGKIVSSNLQVHHIKPRNKYPELMFEPDNLITLCKFCNVSLGTQEHLDFEVKRFNDNVYKVKL